MEFEDGATPVTGRSDTTAWIPGREAWETIKTHARSGKATIIVRGVKMSLFGILPGRAVSEAKVSISVSPDSVGAPIFYRDVPLPFNFAKEKMELIQWRLGDISNPERPPIAIENLPVCGNCHTFSRDGSTLAMDVDSGGDKGAYAITPFEEQTFLSKDRLITWNDFRRDQGAISFGLLAQISPDGRFVASTVEDRVIFLGKEGTKLEFSQLFFPVKGIVAYYDRAAKTIKALPGRPIRISASRIPRGVLTGNTSFLRRPHSRKPSSTIKRRTSCSPSPSPPSSSAESSSSRIP